MIIERKCIWCGKEAKDSPRDICWNCIYSETKENERRDEIVTIGMLEDILNSNKAKSLGHIKSKKKAESSRKNGSKGGRPKKLLIKKIED